MATGCTSDEKQRILEETRGYGDKQHAAKRERNNPGEVVVPSTEPNWDYNTTNGLKTISNMITALGMEIKRYIKKSVNYEREREITPGKENPAVFHNQLVEGVHKHAKTDPPSKV